MVLRTPWIVDQPYIHDLQLSVRFLPNTGSDIRTILHGQVSKKCTFAVLGKPRDEKNASVGDIVISFTGRHKRLSICMSITPVTHGGLDIPDHFNLS